MPAPLLEPSLLLEAANLVLGVEDAVFDAPDACCNEASASLRRRVSRKLDKDVTERTGLKSVSDERAGMFRDVALGCDKALTAARLTAGVTKLRDAYTVVGVGVCMRKTPSRN